MLRLYPALNPKAILASPAAAFTSGSPPCPARFASATHSAWIVTSALLSWAISL
ncbi:MAG: hypothetical protein ACRYG8_26355 [Janthinobacterium lividum]